MLQTNENEKLVELIKAAESILVIGTSNMFINRRVTMFATGKQVTGVLDPNARYDLIIINELSPSITAAALAHVKYSCNIFIGDYGTNMHSKAIINKFIDANINQVQVSKQLMQNGCKERHLYIRYDSGMDQYTRDDPVSIFLVLKTGGDVFDHRYVNATAKSIKANITHPHEIVCLTDNPAGITEVDRIVLMRHNWPKWWGKIELFREGITKNKHCIFFDLDTAVIGNIDNLCKLPHEFLGIRDFYSLNILQTGIMKWEVGAHSKKIYEDFVSTDFSKYINKGDHEWVGSIVKNPAFLQDLLPGQICSYKKHLAHIAKNFMSPSIVCFHGEPRPHKVRDTFITEHWKY